MTISPIKLGLQVGICILKLWTSEHQDPRRKDSATFTYVKPSLCDIPKISTPNQGAHIFSMPHPKGVTLKHSSLTNFVFSIVRNVLEH